MRWTPHQLIEGCLIGAYAIQRDARLHLHPRRVLRGGADPGAGDRGGVRGGLRGQERDGQRHRPRRHAAPRRRRVHLRRRDRADELAGGPPRRAAAQAALPGGLGAFGKPSTINNVETLCAVPHIINNGADWYKAVGHGEVPGHQALLRLRPRAAAAATTRSRSASTSRSSSTTSAADPPTGRKHQGGDPGRHLGADPDAPTSCDIGMDYEAWPRPAPCSGCGSVIVMDDTTDIVKQVRRMVDFYAHESCGQCTPCREGTAWAAKILRRIENGWGTEADLDTLLDISRQHDGQDDLRALRRRRRADRLVDREVPRRLPRADPARREPGAGADGIRRRSRLAVRTIRGRGSTRNECRTGSESDQEADLAQDEQRRPSPAPSTAWRSRSRRAPG